MYGGTEQKLIVRAFATGEKGSLPTIFFEPLRLRTHNRRETNARLALLETQDQLTILRRRGCEEMPGFLFSQPVPPMESVSMLVDEKRPRRTNRQREGRRMWEGYRPFGRPKGRNGGVMD
jgi:hypothetical protein